MPEILDHRDLYSSGPVKETVSARATLGLVHLFGSEFNNLQAVCREETAGDESWGLRSLSCPGG